MSKIVRIVVGDIATNCYILQSNDEIAVIDPGFDGDKILNYLKKMEGKVTHIINTHGHIDHIGANNKIKEVTDAKIYIHKDDAEMLRHPAQNLSLLLGELIQSPKANFLVEEDDIIKIGQQNLKVIHTPGHTKGSICLMGDNYVFTGDTLFFDSVGRTDLPGANEEQLFESLKKIKSRLSDEMIIYPGHGEWGTFKEIKNINPFLQFDD